MVKVFVPCTSRHAPDDFAHIAQSVEHFLGKEEVIGSIPIMGSRICSTCDLSLANTTTDNKTR